MLVSALLPSLNIGSAMRDTLNHGQNNNTDAHPLITVNQNKSTVQSASPKAFIVHV
jgi:hypothetical protein